MANRTVTFTVNPDSAAIVLASGILTYTDPALLVFNRDTDDTKTFEAGRTFTLTVKIGDRFAGAELKSVTLTRVDGDQLTAELDPGESTFVAIVENQRVIPLGMDITDDQDFCYGVIHNLEMRNLYYRP